jgi:hypothetical protein
MYARTYAQIIGVVLLLVGVIGLVLGDRVWLGILNVDIVEDIVHLITGGLLAYVGFGRVDLTFTRTVVGVLGVIYLVVGVLGFVVPMIFGLIPHGYTLFDNLLHLALGILSIALAWFIGERGQKVPRTKRRAGLSTAASPSACPYSANCGDGISLLRNALRTDGRWSGEVPLHFGTFSECCLYSRLRAEVSRGVALRWRRPRWLTVSVAGP